MIPTFQLGQTGQASNQGRSAWRAVGVTNMTLLTSTDYTFNIEANVKDVGNLRPIPDLDRFTVPSSAWYVASGGYKMNSYPSTSGYNSTILSMAPPSPATAHPGCWHENHMSTGYVAGKMVFGVGHISGGGSIVITGNQYSNSSIVVPGNSIHLEAIALHNNMIPYGVDLAGSATSLGNITATPLTYTSAYRDDGGFWSGTAYTNLTVPTGGAGWYAMSGWYRLLNPTQNTGGARGLWRLNGSGILGGSSTPCDNGSKSPPAAAVYYLNEGDYVEFIGDQNVGSAWSTERQRVGLVLVNTTDGVRVYRSTAQSIAQSSTTAISFDTATRDDLGAWTIGDPTKLTVPAGKSGWYIITGTTHWAAFTGSDRELKLVVDGVTEISSMQQWAPSYHNDPRMCAGTVYYLNEGQYVELHLRNGVTNSSVSTQGTLSLAMVRVDIG